MAFVKKRKIQGLDVLEVPGDPQGPTVLLFHGYGADAEDLLGLTSAFENTKVKPTFFFPTGPLDVPISPGYVGKGWFPINVEILKIAIHEEHPEEALQAFPTEFSQIRGLCQNFISSLNVDLSKLYIGGFSQGAIIATEIALHAPQNVGALFIFSGMLVNEKVWRKQAQFHKGTPFFQSHGQHDSLLPFAKAKALETLLLESGWKGKLHAFHGGHEIPESILNQVTLFFQAKMEK